MSAPPRHAPVPIAIAAPPQLGTRTVTFLEICVYTVGLYVDEAFLQAQQRRLQTLLQDAGAPGATPGKDALPPPLVDALLDGSQRALRIVAYRDAEFSHLRDGLARALEQRAGGGGSPAPSVEQQQVIARDIARFRRMFPKTTLATGEEMVLSCAGGCVSLHHNGRLVSELESPFVCRALFASYLDARSAAVYVKRDAATELRALLAGTP